MKILVNNDTLRAHIFTGSGAAPAGHFIAEAAYAGAPPAPWKFVDGALITSPYPPKVPQEIALWRAKAVIELAGLLTSVHSLLAAMEGDAGVVARAAWSAGAPLARHGATVKALAGALNLTDEQVDAMFIQAAALSV
jgi:hypothetical protein